MKIEYACFGIEYEKQNQDEKFNEILFKIIIKMTKSNWTAHDVAMHLYVLRLPLDAVVVYVNYDIFVRNKLKGGKCCRQH